MSGKSAKGVKGKRHTAINIFEIARAVVSQRWGGYVSSPFGHTINQVPHVCVRICNAGDMRPFDLPPFPSTHHRLIAVLIFSHNDPIPPLSQKTPFLLYS